MSFISTFNSLSVDGWQAKNPINFILQATETISPAQADVELSRSVGINYAGNIIVASAPKYDKTVGLITYTDVGAVCVYTGSGNTWTQTQTLTGNVAGAYANGDVQGYALSISGDGIYIASSGANAYNTTLDGEGIVYIFKSNGSSYTQQTQVAGSGARTNGNFGESVSLDQYGNYMCVGASNELVSSTNSGAAYIFTRSGNTWSQQQRLIPSDVVANLFFGTSCSIDSTGTYAIVGGTGYDGANTNSGAAYVFSRSGSTWTEVQKLTPSNPVVNNQFFGQQVAISDNGNVIAISGPTQGGVPAPYGGSVWIFTKSGSTWTETQRIDSPAPGTGQFGYGLAMDKTGAWLIASNPYTSAPGSYVYYNNQGTFTYIQKINQNELPNAGDYSDQLACSEGASYVLVNHPGANETYVNQGNFEIYKQS
jgi:hypothetical protein